MIRYLLRFLWRHIYLTVSLAVHAALLTLFYYYGAYQPTLEQQERKVAASARPESHAAMRTRVSDMERIKDLMRESLGDAPPDGHAAVQFDATTAPPAPADMLAQAEALAREIDALAARAQIKVKPDPAAAPAGTPPAAERGRQDPAAAAEQAQAQASPSPRQQQETAQADRDPAGRKPSVASAAASAGAQAAASASSTASSGAASASQSSVASSAGAASASSGPASAGAASLTASAASAVSAGAGGGAMPAGAADAAGQGTGQSTAAGAASGAVGSGASAGTEGQGSGMSAAGAAARIASLEQRARDVLAQRQGQLEKAGAVPQGVAARMAAFAHQNVPLAGWATGLRYTFSSDNMFHHGGGQMAKIDTASMRKGSARLLGAGGEFSNRVYVNSWYLIGPFPGKHGKDMFNNDSYPPEQAVVLDAAYRGKDGRFLTWRYFHAAGYPLVPPDIVEDSVYYGYTEMMMDKDRDMTMWLGADDDAQVWVNDQLVWKGGNVNKQWFFDAVFNSGVDYSTAYNLNEGKVPAHFTKGRNKLFFKLSNGPNKGFLSMVLTQ